MKYKILTGQYITNDLNDRFAVAFTNGSRWFNQLLDVVRYAIPSMDGLNILYQYNDQGRFVEFYVDNHTPQIAASKRASDLHSLLLPAGRRWGQVYTDGKFNDLLSQKVFEIMQTSNIHSIAHSVFMDLNIGLGAIWIDSFSKEEPLVFKALTGVAVLPEYSDSSNPKNVWFRRAINDIELKSYGRDPQSYTSSENMNFVTCGFIHNRHPDGTVVYKVKNANKWEWLYVEVLNTEWTQPLALEARRFKQLHVINDSVRAGDSRGRGVAIKLLGDIVYLNELTKNLKDGVKFKSKPPILANPALGNFNFSNLAGGILPSTLATDGVPLLQPLQWDFDVVAVNDMKIMLEDKINMAFNVMPLGDIGSAVRTATEISARQAEAQRESLTDVSRMVFDFDAVFKTCLKMLEARGIVGKGKHDITFRNPMLDVENQSQLNALLTYKQMSDQLIDPNFSQMMTSSLAVDAYLKEKLNIPAYLNNSPAEVVANGLKIQQMQAQAPQAQTLQMQQGSQAIAPTPAQDPRAEGFGI